MWSEKGNYYFKVVIKPSYYNGCNFSWQHKTWKCLDKNYNIFLTTRFNHTIIFFKLIDKYKLSDIYINDNNWLGHKLIT